MKKLAKILSLSLALVMYAVVLTACSPSIDSVKKKYEDAGYTVKVAEKEALENLGTELCGHEDALEWAFAAKKKNNEAVVVCFKDLEAADFAYRIIGTRANRAKLDGKVLYMASSYDALIAK